MPFFEYYCPQTHKIYTFFARRSSDATLIPPCPDNPSYAMQKCVSAFSVTGLSSKSEKQPQSDSFDANDSRMEASMAEVERMMGAIDADNPDPTQMGRMLRRIAELSGESLDPNMEVMIRKLEEGCDPEALEDEFGSDFQAQERSDTDDHCDPSTEPLPHPKLLGLNVAKKREPVRDPNLYDFPSL